MSFGFSSVEFVMRSLTVYQKPRAQLYHRGEAVTNAMMAPGERLPARNTHLPLDRGARRRVSQGDRSTHRDGLAGRQITRPGSHRLGQGEYRRQRDEIDDDKIVTDAVRTRQRIGLVDEQNSVEGILAFLKRLWSSLAYVATNKIGALNFNQMAFGKAPTPL